MKRWHEDKYKMISEQKDDVYFRGRKMPLGKYRKRKANDCGKSRCYICHYEKLLKIKTKKDKIADLNYKEQKK